MPAAQYAPLTAEEVTTFLADWELLHGVGDFSQHRACTMSAAVALTRVRRGEDMNGATDSLECVCPVVRRLVIARNDLTPVEDGQLKTWATSMIPRIVGTNAGRDLSIKRAEHIARYAVRVIAAEAMDSAKLPDEAAKLRAISDEQSMSAIRDVASEARDTARKERDERYAADAAAYAADAAAYAADAAAYAADAAAYAADAARRASRVRHMDALLELVLAIKE